MKTFTKEQRKHFVEQVLASEAIEGYRPDADFLSLLERYIAGELTAAQLDTLTEQKFSYRKVKSI